MVFSYHKILQETLLTKVNKSLPQLPNLLFQLIYYFGHSGQIL